VEARILAIPHRAGDRIDVGEEIVSLDTSATSLDAAKLDDALLRKESDLARVRLEIDQTVAGLRAQLEQKQLDAKIFQFKAEQSDRLFAEGLASAQEKLAAETAAKKSDIEIAELRDGLSREKRTAAAQIATAELDLATARKERNEARHQLQLARMRSDRAGVLTWIVPEVGAMVRRGDVMARVSDLSAYRVAATISDAHASKLAAGLPVRVRIDEATTIAGTIRSVEPRIENGVAKFYVALDQPANARLRNNLRVDVFVITGHRDGVLAVRRGALGQGESDFVFVVRGDRAVRTPVRLGLVGEEQVEIAGGVRPGDEIVISDMSDYANVKEVRIK